MFDLKQSFQYSFTIILLFIITFGGNAQDSLSLEGKFKEMMSKYNTYERYKVIPISVLENFWAEVEDTVGNRNATINQLESQIKAQQTEIDTLQRRLGSVQASLRESRMRNETIEFIGIPFSKSGYHITVWVIIGILAIICLFVYYLYKRSNKVTTKVKREFELLKNEFENHKDKSREQHLRLKRELQTALNLIEEMKRNGSRSSNKSF